MRFPWGRLGRPCAPLRLGHLWLRTPASSGTAPLHPRVPATQTRPCRNESPSLRASHGPAPCGLGPHPPPHLLPCLQAQLRHRARLLPRAPSGPSRQRRWRGHVAVPSLFGEQRPWHGGPGRGGVQRARGWCGRSLTVNKKPLRARQSVDVALVTADTSEGLFLTVDVCPLRRVTSKREVPCLRHALPELHSEAPLGSWPPELGSHLCGSEQPRPARCPAPRPLPAGPTWWPRSAARRPRARCTPQGWTARGLGCCSRSLGLPRGPG